MRFLRGDGGGGEKQFYSFFSLSGELLASSFLPNISCAFFRQRCNVFLGGVLHMSQEKQDLSFFYCSFG